MQQTAFMFDLPPSFEEEDFIPSEAQEDALFWVQHWPEAMPRPTQLKLPFQHALWLYGEQGAGKTHLAHIWQKRVGATFLTKDQIYHTDPSELAAKHRFMVIDNVEQLTDEVPLFHLLWNLKTHDAYVLITAKKPVSRMGIRLPDLRSRLNILPSVAILPPDDLLVRTLLLKHFSDLQLKVEAPLIDYIATHIERSFQAIADYVEILNQEAMAQHRKITLPLVREVLSQTNLN
jgi:chromosomal replication initiation ATPase DnaA